MNRIAKRIERYKQTIKAGDLVYIIAHPDAPIFKQKKSSCDDYDYREIYLEAHTSALFLGWAAEKEWSGGKTMKVLLSQDICYVNARRVYTGEDLDNFHRMKKEYGKFHGVDNE